MSEARKHYKYGASSAHRWMRCHASVRLAGLVGEDQVSDYAQDGTEAHALVEYALSNDIRDADFAFSFSGMKWVYRTDTHKDRIDSVQTCLDYVNGILADFGKDTILFLERQLPFPSLVSDDVGGTVDICIYIPALRWLIVVDFKHGAGVTVKAYDNPQGLMYATCAKEDLEKRGMPVDLIQIVIVQPRAEGGANPVKTYVCGPGRLAAYKMEVDKAIEAGEGPNPAYAPSVEACRFCPAKLNCAAREQLAMQNVREQFANVQQITINQIPTPADMPTHKLAHVMAHHKVLEQFIEDCKKEALRRAMAGERIDGFKVTYAQARRSWDSDDLAMAQKVMQLVGTDDYDKVFPRSMIGVGEAEKLFKENLKASGVKGKEAAHATKLAFADLTTKKSSGSYALVPLDDPREEVNRVAALQGAVVIPQQ